MKFHIFNNIKYRGKAVIFRKNIIEIKKAMKRHLTNFASQ